MDMTSTLGKTSKLQLRKPRDLESHLEMEDERDLRVCETACGQGHPLELVPYSKLPNTDSAEISRSASMGTSQDAALAGLIWNNLQCV